MFIHFGYQAHQCMLEIKIQSCVPETYNVVNQGYPKVMFSQNYYIIFKTFKHFLCVLRLHLCFTKYELYKYSGKIKGQVQNIFLSRKIDYLHDFQSYFILCNHCLQKKGNQSDESWIICKDASTLVDYKCISYLQRQRLNCIILIV